MSQREKRGFNRDPAVFAVSEGEDGEVGPGTIAASAGSAPPVWFGPPLLPSVALGVFHPQSCEAAPSVSPAPFPLLCLAFNRSSRAKCLSMSQLAFIAWASGVGHPVHPLSDMRRADAVCAQYDRPAGVAFAFQVCEYSIEPSVPNRACNLLTNDAVRAALADEPEHLRPQVPFVARAFPLACR